MMRWSHVNQSQGQATDSYHAARDIHNMSAGGLDYKEEYIWWTFTLLFSQSPGDMLNIESQKSWLKRYMAKLSPAQEAELDQAVRAKMSPENLVMLDLDPTYPGSKARA